MNKNPSAMEGFFVGYREIEETLYLNLSVYLLV